MGPYKKTVLLVGVGYCAFSLLSVSIVAHPQCLDSLPPFEREKSWCKDYQTDMCCTGGDEVTMIFQKVIPTIRKALTTDRNKFNSSCLNGILRVACTRCSPWAQHMYEGVQSEGLPFPSLCKPFCKDFYTTCYTFLFDYFKLNATKYPRGDPGAESFCKDHEANVPYYCYPDIVSGPKFSTSESVSNTDDKDCLCGVTVASGLRNPLAAIPPGDESGRLFIPEQKGKIRVLTKENVLLSNPFLDIASEVLVTARRGDERGLLGMAFHPNYVQNGRFYVYYSSYTNSRHISKVSEFKVSSTSPNVADPNSERVIFTINQPEGNHNGGQVFFKDGYLYIVLGDGGGAYDRHGRVGNGLDTSTLHGSILRVDVSNPNVTYTIPPDNPFADGIGGRPEIFAYGLRNPWRCSVDRGDANGRGKGRIFCGDVGQNKFEEIDIIEKGGNYGWRAYEGFHCSDAALCKDSLSSNATPPIYAYPHSVGQSVTGGYMYRGCLFPRLRGQYIYGDFTRGKLFSLTENKESGTWTNRNVCLGSSRVCHDGLLGAGHLRHILSFAEDEDGELYVLTTDLASAESATGSLILLVDPSRRSDPSSCPLTRQVPT